MKENTDHKIHLNTLKTTMATSGRSSQKPEKDKHTQIQSLVEKIDHQE